MDRKTLKALKGSIKKWLRIANGTGYDNGANNCPLCKLFVDDTFCIPCPIAIDVGGEWGCDETPYYAWSNYWWLERVAVGPRRCVTNAKQQDMAIEEYSYLLSLLPEEEF